MINALNETSLLNQSFRFVSVSLFFRFLLLTLHSHKVPQHEIEFKKTKKKWKRFVDIMAFTDKYWKQKVNMSCHLYIHIHIPTYISLFFFFFFLVKKYCYCVALSMIVCEIIIFHIMIIMLQFNCILACNNLYSI